MFVTASSSTSKTLPSHCFDEVIVGASIWSCWAGAGSINFHGHGVRLDLSGGGAEGTSSGTSIVSLLGNDVPVWVLDLFIDAPRIASLYVFCSFDAVRLLSEKNTLLKKLFYVLPGQTLCPHCVILWPT